MVHMKTYKTAGEWLNARTSYIGGSDAASILGLSPWRSNVQLWEEKTGRAKHPDISDNPAVRYGSKAEEYLRALFALDFPQYEVWYEPWNMWTNDRYPFCHASLDGAITETETGRRGILEIKTSNIQSAAQREKWNGAIPDAYFCQILHYLAVTEFDFAIVKAQLRSDYGGEIRLDTRHYYIDRKEVENDIQILMDAEKEFSDAIKNDTCPPLVLPGI